jgi:hypothetical protein
VTAIVDDLERFWSDAPVPGLRYERIGPGRVSSDREDASSCGGQPLDSSELRDNAIYCGPDDYVYYDQRLFDRLSSDVGESVPAMVLAHEWGHRIQWLSNTPLRSVLVAELQADCYSAAWVRDAQRRDEVLTSDDPLLDLYRTSVVIGDQEPLMIDDPSAHGTAFDRAGVMSIGWEGGVSACVDLVEDPPRTVQGSVEIVEGGGDVPFDEVVTIAVEALDVSNPGPDLGLENVSVRGCGSSRDGTAACGDGTIGVDIDQLADLYDSIGDMAAWVPIVEAYLTEVDGEAAATRTDCAMGALARSMLGDGLLLPSSGTYIALSSEDLDELVLQLSAGVSGQVAFERLAALRSGFDVGWRACA